MKNHSLKSVVSLIIGLCAVCACTKFDDSALWQAINKNAADIAALKEKTNNLNSDIVALQQLVAAIQNRDYITNCTPLADGSGYTVAFNSGKSIVVRNGRNGADGKDGTDGTTPQIGVAKDTDAAYYQRFIPWKVYQNRIYRDHACTVRLVTDVK